MIFVAVGTHPGQFDRIIKRIDDIAPEVKEKIIIQKGFTKYVPKNCEYFDFTENIDSYYKKARLVILQSATSLLEFVLKYRKPAITIPRRAKFKEHLNDHQVEFGEFFAKRTGIKCILEEKELTSDLLNNYNKIAIVEKDNLQKLQNYFKSIFYKESEKINTEKPFSNNRLDYIINLVEPEKDDKILNIGISNIPEIEMKIEDKIKECWTVDIDKNKLDSAKKYLKKTKLLCLDVTKKSILKKNYFDKVLIIEVLEHLDNDYEMIEIIRSLLKPGGKLIVGVPNNAFLHYFNPVKYFEHKRHYSNEMIKKLLERNGFVIEHFNLVETWTILLNLYVHLVLKFIFKKEFPFGIFKKRAKNSYKKFNSRGMDILIKATKDHQET